MNKWLKALAEMTITWFLLSQFVGTTITALHAIGAI